MPSINRTSGVLILLFSPPITCRNIPRIRLQKNPPSSFFAPNNKSHQQAFEYALTQEKETYVSQQSATPSAIRSLNRIDLPDLIPRARVLHPRSHWPGRTHRHLARPQPESI